MKPSLLVGVFVCTLITSFVAAQVPVNDECAGAIPLSFGTNPAPAASGNTYSNVNATLSAGYPAPCSTMNSDVWFSFTAPATDQYQIDTNTPAGFAAGTELDTVVAVYPSCNAGTAPIACDDDTGAGNLSQLSVGLVAGQTVYVRVGDFGTSINPGTFYVNVNQDTSTFNFIFSSPSQGCVRIDIKNGVPNGTYYFAATLNQGAFPNGWLYGVDIPFSEVQSELNSGYPYVGPLDAGGDAVIGPYCGLSGITAYAVVIDFVSGLGTPAGHTPARSFLIP